MAQCLENEDHKSELERGRSLIKRTMILVVRCEDSTPIFIIYNMVKLKIYGQSILNKQSRMALWASRTTQQEKQLIAKPDDLSSIHGTHTVRETNQVVL